MSSDTEMKDKDGNVYSYDNISQAGYLLGHIPGMETVCGLLRTKALAMFTCGGHDDEAVKLRNMANEIQEELEDEYRAKMAEHDKECPAIIRCEGQDDAKPDPNTLVDNPDLG